MGVTEFRRGFLVIDVDVILGNCIIPFAIFIITLL